MILETFKNPQKFWSSLIFIFVVAQKYPNLFFYSIISIVIMFHLIKQHFDWTELTDISTSVFQS